MIFESGAYSNISLNLLPVYHWYSASAQPAQYSGDLSLLKIEDENGELVEANLVDSIIDLQDRMQWQELK